jgi:hypothetical protein
MTSQHSTVAYQVCVCINYPSLPLFYHATTAMRVTMQTDPSAVLFMFTSRSLFKIPYKYTARKTKRSSREIYH